jgi:hypothetical protein
MAQYTVNFDVDTVATHTVTFNAEPIATHTVNFNTEALGIQTVNFTPTPPPPVYSVSFSPDTTESQEVTFTTVAEELAVDFVGGGTVEVDFVTGIQGPIGPIGPTGPTGPAGNGLGVLPTGGATDEVLTKVSATDFDLTWTLPPNTKGRFNTALTDGTFLYVGDVATNVPTALSIGTVTAITYGITTDGGADDLVLPEANTTQAGLLGADKWDEIVANTAKVTFPGFTSLLADYSFTDNSANWNTAFSWGDHAGLYSVAGTYDRLTSLLTGTNVFNDLIVTDGLVESSSVRALLLNDFKTPTSGNILVGSGTDFESVVMSGDATIIADGTVVVSIQASDVTDFDTEVANNSAVTANTAKVTFPGFTSLLADYSFTDSSANWNTAFGWGDHSGLYMAIGQQLAVTKTLVAGEFFTSYTSGTGVFTSATPPDTNDNDFVSNVTAALGVLTFTGSGGAFNSTVDLKTYNDTQYAAIGVTQWTEALTRGTVLTGFSASGPTTIIAGSTILQALGYLEYRVALNDAKVTNAAEINDLSAAVTWANIPIANVPTGTTASTVSLGNHTHELSDLTDVDSTVGSPTDGKIMVYRTAGTDWVLEDKPVPGGGGATQLDELSDVTTVAYTNRHVLVADGVDYDSRLLVEADISDLGTYLTSETSHADVIVDGDFVTNGLMKRTGVGTYSIVTDSSADWNTAFGWGDHDGLYMAIGQQLAVTKALVANEFFTSYTSTTGVFTSAIPDHDQLTNYSSAEHIDWALTNAANIHADNYTVPVISDVAYNATSWNTNLDGASKNAIRDKVETMDTAIALNTAKDTNIVYPAETITTVNALSITTVGIIGVGTWQGTAINQTYLVGQSGTNTGDNSVNTLYSGLVSNANHSGDATGATALTLATVNSNVGTFTHATITVNAKGLITAASSGTDNNENFYLSGVTPNPTTVTLVVTGASDQTLVAANVTNAGVMTTAMYDDHILNNAKTTFPGFSTLSADYSYTEPTHAFFDLTDVDPTTYTGQAGKGVRVNAIPDGLEFYTIVDGDTTDHTLFSNIGTNTHAQIDTHIALTDEHIDWSLTNAKNIHADNYTDTNDNDFVITAGSSWNSTTGLLTLAIPNQTNATVAVANLTTYLDTLYAGIGVTQWTEALTLGTDLLGFSAASGGAVVAADTILQAFGKLENRVILNDAKVSDVDHNTLTNLGFTVGTGEITSSDGTNITVGSFGTVNTNYGFVVGSNSLGATYYLDGSGAWSQPAGSGDMILASVQTVTGAKTFDSGKLILSGATSGTSILNAAAVAGTTTLTLPGTTGTLVLTTDLHDAITVTDSAEINFTLTGQDITASLITGSIDVLKLDAGVQSSLGLADTALQSIAADSITMDMLVDITTDTFLGRVTASTGTVEVLTNAQAKTALDLTGTNSGDQTTIVGITGTKTEFNAALTGGSFAYVGDPPEGHDIGDHDDILVATLTTDDLLQWTGLAWINISLSAAGISETSHNHTLDSLSNVTITANASGEILKWNGSAWINNTLAEAGIQAAGSYVTGSGTDNYIPRFNGTTALENSVIYDDGTNIGIGTTTPTARLEVAGGLLHVTGNGTPTGGIGLELEWDGVQSDLLSYDRDTAAYKPIRMRGSTVDFLAGTTNATALFIDTNKNVGIGTTTPSSELHVKGSGDILRLETTTANGNNYLTFYDTVGQKGYIGYGGGATNELTFYNAENSETRFYNNGSEHMRISATGDVGIGETSPDTLLHLTKTSAGAQAVQLILHNSSNTTATEAAILFVNRIDAELTAPFRRGELAMSTDASGYQDFHVRLADGTSLNERLTVLGSNGDVGIGTTSPYAKLHVDNSTAFTLTSSQSGQDDIYITNTVAGGDNVVKGTIGFGNGTNARRAAFGTIQTSTDADVMGFAWYTHPSGTGADPLVEKMRLEGNGNVGIGTTTPDAKLDISGTIKLLEQASADGDTAAKGQIWVKNSDPNELWYTDGEGLDQRLSQFKEPDFEPTWTAASGTTGAAAVDANLSYVVNGYLVSIVGYQIFDSNTSTNDVAMTLPITPDGPSGSIIGTWRSQDTTGGELNEEGIIVLGAGENTTTCNFIKPDRTKLTYDELTAFDNSDTFQINIQYHS